MADTSGYMIRLELLKLAKEILEHQYYSNVEKLRMELGVDRYDGSTKIPLDRVQIMSTEDVISQAEKLNEFISRKN